MAKCKQCGRSGLFLPLNNLGHCPDCARDNIEAKQKLIHDSTHVTVDPEQLSLGILSELSHLRKEELGFQSGYTRPLSLSGLYGLTLSALPNPHSFPLSSFVALDVCFSDDNVVTGAIQSVSAMQFEDYIPVSYCCCDCDGSDGHNESPSFCDISKSLAEYIGDYPVVGYDIFSDVKFLYYNGMSDASKFSSYYDIRFLAPNRPISFSDLANDFCSVDMTDKHPAGRCYTIGDIFSCLANPRK